MTDQALRELAERVGVATAYWGWDGQHNLVSEATLRAVLAELGVDATSPDATRRSYDDLDVQPWRRALPPFTAVRERTPRTVEVHVPAGSPAAVEVGLEGGAHGPRDWRPLRQVDNWEPDRVVDGRPVGEASFALPTDLPPGYHTLRLTSGGDVADAVLLVYPYRLSLRDKISDDRAWGWATQIYSVRSHADWGIGDLATLTGLAAGAAQHGADFVLVNPMHASGTRPPLESSPYSPSHRAFLHPIYIRPESIAEYAELSAARRAEIEQSRADTVRVLPFNASIDRNTAWSAKIPALRAIHAVPRSPEREAAYDEFRAQAGAALDRFAVWSAIAAEYGASRAAWPVELQDAGSAAVAALAERSATEVDFYRWLQWVGAEQLEQARSTAADAGMRVGIINDLAVGVGGDSAEVWAEPEIFATGMSVGAPPDDYNALGQNWGQTPWRPTALADAGYEPFRRLVRRLLRDCDGLRIDHVMGLSRLWWIPDGSAPTEGTYVRYDAESMIGVLLMEATRAGAVLVGEDLGTVEPGFRDLIGDRGVLGTSILWFERQEDGSPRPAEEYRRACMSSVTTHDLAPTAGYLRGAHIHLRDRLDLLPYGAEREWAGLWADLQRWRDVLTERGMLEPGGDEDAMLLALHRYLCATPSQLLAVALTDAVGDVQLQNQPGTSLEYRNWQVPLCDTDGRPVPLEDLFDHPGTQRLATLMRHGTHPDAG